MATKYESYDEYMSRGTPKLCKESEMAVGTLLPDKSRAAYEASYNRFLAWQKKHHATSFSQRVLVPYFTGLSKKWKASTLWSEYSKLSKILKVKKNVDVSEYLELKSFLKKQAVGYRPKKSKALNAKNVEDYLNKAPDETCLATKVAVIFGVLGACRKDELIKIETTHLKSYYEHEDTEKIQPMLLVHLPDTKTHQGREFTIKGKFYEFYKRYSDLRPAKTPHNRFFVSYHKGKCTVQPIGEKKFASMPKQVAEFLKLPNAELYTGNALRRTSATLLAERGADIAALKRRGESTLVAEGHIENSLPSKGKISDQITSSIHLGPSLSNQAPLKENLRDPKPKDSNLPSTSKDLNSSEKENSDPSIDTVISDEQIILNIKAEPPEEDIIIETMEVGYHKSRPLTSLYEGEYEGVTAAASECTPSRKRARTTISCNQTSVQTGDGDDQIESLKMERVRKLMEYDEILAKHRRNDEENLANLRLKYEEESIEMKRQHLKVIQELELREAKAKAELAELQLRLMYEQ